MASAEFTLDLLKLPEVQALVVASVELIKSRNGGADVWEARHEVAAIEAALEGLGIRVPDRFAPGVPR